MDLMKSYVRYNMGLFWVRLTKISAEMKKFHPDLDSSISTKTSYFSTQFFFIR